MNKKPTPQQVFFDRWAPSYDRTITDYGYGAPQRIFEDVWPCLRNRPEPVLRLLDLGIGTGMTSKPFAATGRTHITGIDISDRMLDLGRAARAADEFIRLDAARDDLPFAEQAFDVVISGGMFEFIHDPEELIREISRVLRPGGIVAVTFETPRTRDLYPPGMFQGVLENGEDRVVIQRFVIQNLRPCLYRKYLFSPEIVQLMFEGYGINTLKNADFVAYKWPGGREVVYNIYLGQRL
jgi:ubiquinone/menaquinone biosynthesis C-methylase UbiE